MLSSAMVWTPGWIVDDKSDDLKMVSTLLKHDNEWQYAFDTVIPKKFIVSRTILEETWEDTDGTI